MSQLAHVGLVPGGAPPLYLRGTLPSQPGIAVVGTRMPTKEACAWTTKQVAEIAASGLSIWSGGALGIDAAAHRSALAAGAPTVLVTAGGLDDPYPKCHAELQQQILAAGGALMSLQPDGGPRRRFHFPKRNHVLVALTVATLMVQGERKSGSRHTAGTARHLGRLLMVVPGAPWHRLGEGGALEIAAGGATAVTCAQDVLNALERGAHSGQTTLDAFWSPQAPSEGRKTATARPRQPSAAGSDLATGRQSRSSLPPLDPVQRKVLAQLGDRAEHIDLICERAQLAYPAVSRALLTMHLLTVVVEGPAGHFRRA